MNKYVLKIKCERFSPHILNGPKLKYLWAKGHVFWPRGHA